MTDLTAFAEHCRAMATAEHKPECRVWDGSSWGRWVSPAPDCAGCNSSDDRALFARLAAEVDDYLDPHPTLEGM